MDIRAFFDTVPWDLVVKAVAAHTDARGCCSTCPVASAPLQQPDGTAIERHHHGTPQGSAVSPVLANLFMHYTFDMWLTRNHPEVVVERYADLCRARHKSAYAEVRVMPTWLVDALAGGLFTVPASA